MCIRAREGEIEATWLQTVRVDPQLNEERDRQAFVQILGVEDFLSYLQSLINNLEFDGIERDNDDGGGKGIVLEQKIKIHFAVFVDLLQKLIVTSQHGRT